MAEPALFSNTAPDRGWAPQMPAEERAVAEGQTRVESVTSHALGALSSMPTTTTEELAAASKQP